MSPERISFLEAADIYLVYLPSYSPQLSQIEPIWKDVKHHYLPKRSYQEVACLKEATEEALDRKAALMISGKRKTTNHQRIAA